MSLALEKNGLNSFDVRPWHIRGNYTIYDIDGKVDDKGVYEEWWVSPTRYKRSFTGYQLTQTDYATGTGLFRDGLMEWTDAQVSMREHLIEPVPEIPSGEFKLKERSISVGNVKLGCVELKFPLGANLTVGEDFFPLYCLDPSLPALRLVTHSSPYRTVYNRIVQFQGHYLAREMHLYSAERPVLEISLDEIEDIAQVPDSFPDPPPSAQRVDLSKISLDSEGVRFGAIVLLKKAVPVYADSAKSRGVQGKVTLKGVIEKDGRVDRLNVTDGPAELQQAAMDAVSKWVYQPFRVMGEPRPVEMEFNVVFSLGKFH